MSKKYIEREAVEKILENAQLIFDGENCGYCTGDVNIDEIPAADVAPVVHGAWGEWENGAGYYCTVCGKDALCDGVEQEVLSNYCPSCGARMDDEKR